jgi:hypothetical protein
VHRASQLKRDGEARRSHSDRAAQKLMVLIASLLTHI